jgi:uracil-DNA glycosylase
MSMKKTLSVMCMVIAQSLAVTAAERGSQTDYDAGANKDSRWPDLFAETPNYRAFGQAVIGGTGEKFRWNMGPMWYRGRLTPNDVKVFIVGQEGAQDENVSNRSFTGSTGTRMQNFINYLGIDRSYLYMNTFVYTITGQYSLFGEDREDAQKLKELKRLLWLAQDENSIVVKHRHELFNYMLETNNESLSLVIGVGTAGKDSVATWFKSQGAKCSSKDLSVSFCEGAGDLAGVYGIGVEHPGGASARNGGDEAGERIRADFERKAKIVSGLINQGKLSLDTDPGMKRGFAKPFKYGYAAIPHRDFAFGTPWVMGAYSTTSNRRGADGVQIFSSNGCYNNTQRINGRCDALKTQALSYDNLEDLLGMAPAEMSKGDVPYESPKSKDGRRLYDAGPGALAKPMLEYFNAAIRFFKAGASSKEIAITQHPSFGPQGIYRGRAENADVLVIADQVSHTDMFSGRALTGAAGQRLQTLLNSMGVYENYFILRSLPVDCLDRTVEACTAIATDSNVVDARLDIINGVLAKGNVKLILAVGPTASSIVKGLNVDVKTVEIAEIADPGLKHKEAFNKALRQVKDLGLRFEASGSSSYSGKLTVIPRQDLPAYTRWWMGTSGDTAARAYEIVNGKRRDNGDYYMVKAPRWATKWRAGELNSSEKESLRLFQESGL